MLSNIFTISSEWALMTWVVEQVREAVRRRRRNRFFFLDALVQERLTNACKGYDVPADLPDGEAVPITPLQALFRGDLATLTEGCTPNTIHKCLADALKEQIKHASTGSWTFASARAPTLAATVRIRWFRDPERPKYTHSILLLDFEQYDAVPTAILQQIASIPAFDDEASEEARANWEATYSRAAREAQEWTRRL